MPGFATAKAGAEIGSETWPATGTSRHSEQANRPPPRRRPYKDVPMDFTDATLVAAAELLKLRRIFTLDRDFLVYRTAGRKPFEVLPRR